MKTTIYFISSKAKVLGVYLLIDKAREDAKLLSEIHGDVALSSKDVIVSLAP